MALLCAFADSTGTDYTLGRDFLYGFPLTGHVQSSNMHREIERPDAESFTAKCANLQRGAWTALLSLESSIRAHSFSTPVADRRELVEVTDAQVDSGKLAGPFSRSELFERLYGNPHPVILPDGSIRAPVCATRFGVRQPSKFRPCEDWRSNGQNECTSLGETIAPISFDEPALLAEEILDKASQLKVTSPTLTIAMDDVQGGYNNLPADQEYVMCMWHDERQQPVYYVSKVLPFGSTASVVLQYRVPLLLERVGARLGACLARAYIDDWVITDYTEAGDSAQEFMSAIHSAINIPLAACHHPCCEHCNTSPASPRPTLMPKCKRRRASSIQELLGVVCDMSSAHLGSVTYSPKRSRCDKIISSLKEYQTAQLLTQKQAERVNGKLQFLTHSSVFGRVGRAQSLCFLRRAHGKSMDGRTHDPSVAWTSDMDLALSFLELILHPDRLPSRTISFDEVPPVILYSDAEGETFGIGLFAWDPLTPSEHWYASDVCPQWLLDRIKDLVPPQVEAPRHPTCQEKEEHPHIIAPVEMAGSLSALLTFAHLIRGRRVFLFQDNASAFNAAISGYCDNAAVREISAVYHIAAAALGASIWTEYVSTDAMMADIPSRKNGEGHKHAEAFFSMSPQRVPLISPAHHEWDNHISIFDHLRL